MRGRYEVWKMPPAQRRPLAAVTVVAGFIPFGQFITSDGQPYTIHLDWTVATASVVIAVVVIAIATALYRKKSPIPDRMAAAMPGLHRAAYRRFYMDELYLFITKRIIFNCVSRPIAWFDRHVIDGALNGLANLTQRTSYAIRGIQSGQVQQYAYVILLGTVVIAALTVWLLSM